MLIILNPEMVQVAFFIDAIGMEMFIMLVEIQLLAVLSEFYNARIKPLFDYIKYLYSRFSPPLTWKNFIGTPGSLTFVAHSPAMLMYLLVFSAVIGMTLNVYK